MRDGCLAMRKRVGPGSDDNRGAPRPCASVRTVGALRFGPARCPSRESPDNAVRILLERGYTALEIDFEGGFWMDYPWAERLGELAAGAGSSKRRAKGTASASRPRSRRN